MSRTALDSLNLRLGTANTRPAAAGTMDPLLRFEDEECGTSKKTEDLKKEKKRFNELINMLAASQKKSREEAERAARSRAERAAEEEQEEEEEAAAKQNTAELREQLEKMQEDLLDHDEHRESEAVLVPVVVSAEPETALDPGYLQAAEAAQRELGLDTFFAGLLADDPQAHQAMFRRGVQSGFVQHTAMLQGKASGPTLAGLFATLARSPDSAAAGAAFAALLCLLGDTEAAQSLALDSAYSLPPAVSPMYASLPRPVALGQLPTAAELLAALEFNGYRTPEAVAAAAAEAASKQQKEEQQGQGQQDGQQEEEQGIKRIHAIKLVLQTAVAVCRYCSKNLAASPAAAAAKVLAPRGLTNLLLAVVHLGLDADARLLREDLDAAAAALLSAFTERDWAGALPQLAERVAGLGRTSLACYKVLKQLPASQPRGFALQQQAAALLLARLIPGSSSSVGQGGGRQGGRQGGRPAARGAPSSSSSSTQFDPAALISGQPWFKTPKELVEGARKTADAGGAVAAAVTGATGGSGSSGGGYTVADVCLLLKLCDLLLWPHTIAEPGSTSLPVTPPSRDFLRSWLDWLSYVQRSIKSIHDMDLNLLKVLAAHLETEYSVLLDSGELLLIGSP